MSKSSELKAEIAAFTVSLQETGGELRSMHIHDTVCGIIADIEENLREKIPAIHFGFDDSDENYSLLVTATPALNVRYELQTNGFDIIDGNDIGEVLVRRAMGVENAEMFDRVFELSAALREAELKGVTFIREIDKGDLHLIDAILSQADLSDMPEVS
jgi:hypothetical protein